MAIARLTELRLNSFKSFEGAVLPLAPLTVVTGRNSAGKSNALDGLEVLARLAEGDDIADALDGRRREGGAIRGGSAGCAPHGAKSFSLGCSVESTQGVFVYDLEIEVKPDLRIVSERLFGPGVAERSGRVEDRLLVETRAPGQPGTGIEAQLHNGKRGPNKALVFRDSRLIIAQIPLVLTGINGAEKSVISAAQIVVSALRGVFHLDPVPHLMREFVPRRDVELKRTGSNVSAALQHLERRQSASFKHVIQLISEVADIEVADVDFVRSELDDVMLALYEKSSPNAAQKDRTPAREMSDGMLRFIAIATALLSSKKNLDVDSDFEYASPRSRVAPDQAGVLFVVEELENGLHPSQAERVLDLIRNSNADGRSALFTTHSPALLDALQGEGIEDVMVCFRSRDTGRSELTRLIDLPGYAAALAEGSLGRAVTRGRLVNDVASAREFSEFDRLLGLT